jgi:hypothetical protein
MTKLWSKSKPMLTWSSQCVHQMAKRYQCIQKNFRAHCIWNITTQPDTAFRIAPMSRWFLPAPPPPFANISILCAYGRQNFARDLSHLLPISGFTRISHLPECPSQVTPPPRLLHHLSDAWWGIRIFEPTLRAYLFSPLELVLYSL